MLLKKIVKGSQFGVYAGMTVIALALYDRACGLVRKDGLALRYVSASVQAKPWGHSIIGLSSGQRRPRRD